MKIESILSYRPSFATHAKKTPYPYEISRTDTFERKRANFAMSYETFEKAKNIVIASVTGNNPKESCVCIQNNKIAAYARGNQDRIILGDDILELLDDKYSNVIFIHSHPSTLEDGSANPISYGDFETLNSSPAMKKIYAINPKGEYSSLEKTGKPLSESQVERYYNIFEDNFKREMSESERREFCAIMGEEASFGEVLERNRRKYSEFIAQQNIQKAINNSTHHFWLKYAPELNLCYETNYSCFSGR